MKPKFKSLIAAFAPLSRSSLIVCASLCAATSANAASDAWDGSTDATWATGTNWLLDTTAPGTAEIATFNGAGNANTTIDLGAGVTVGSIIFDTASAAAYTIGSGAVGSQTLTLDNTGAVTMNNTVLTNQLVNANITLGTAITGTTTFTNSNTAVSGITLNVAGTITGGTGGTAGTKTLNTTGAGATNLQGIINKGGATVINVANIGTGNTTLSGSGTSALGTLRATGGSGSSMTVNGQDVTVASQSNYGTSSLSGKFILTTGSAAFNGGIQSATSSGALAGGDGMGFIVNSGTFSASYVALGRSYNFSTTAGATVTTAQNMGTSGFQVNGGTASVTGNVDIAGSNSAANGQVSGAGSLTIGGELRLGATNTRTNLFQVTSGTLTNTDVTNGGIVIGRGTAAAATSGELLLTGGTTTTEKITFGLNGGLAGSFGNLTMNGASANLYVGSGGIVLAATNAYTQTMNLTAGTLGAKANWSTAVGINFTGSGTIIKAADVSDVSRNITLDGVLAGTGGFTKSGVGTLLLTNGANTFSGTATISAGILRSSHANALQNAVVAATGMNIQDGLKIGTGITSPVIGGLSGSAAFELINEDSVPLALKLGNTNATYSGIITGSGSLEKAGGGNQGLTGAVLSHTGGTTLTAGTLQLNDSGNTSATFGSGSLTMNGGRLRLNNSDGAQFNGDLVTTANGGEFSYRANGYFNPSSITGAGTLTLTSDNNATVSSSDFQDFAGTLNLGNGTGTTYFRMVSPFDNSSLGNAAVHLAAGAQLTRNHGTSGAVTTGIGTLSGAATAIVGGSAAGSGTFTFSVGSRNEPATYAGTIVDGGTQTAFTKVGTNTQILSGINTYTGDTTVSGGTLSITNAYLADASTVHIAGGGATMKLDFVGNDTIAALELVGLGMMGPGTYNGTTHPAYFDAAGTGSLVIPAAGGYSNWASANGASPNADDDHDFDGVSNGVEYFIGGPSGLTTGFTPLPGVTNTGGVLSVTWTHAADYTGVYGTGYVIQTSTTLAAGSWTNETLGGNVSIVGDNVTYTFPAGPVKNFARLVVTP